MEKIYINTELLTSNVQKEKVKRQAIIYQFPLRILASLALLLALMLTCTLANAAAKLWAGTITDWGTSSNWSPSGTPTSVDDVTVPTGATFYPDISTGSANAKTVTINAGGSLTVSGGTLTLAAGNDFTNNGTLTISSGASLTISGSNSLTISGNWYNNGGTFNSNTSTVTFNGTGKTISGSSIPTFYNLSTSGTASVTAGLGVSVGGNVTIGSGTTFNASTFTHMVQGNWINNGGTFTPATSTINFNNTSSDQSIQGSEGTQTFNNITVAKTTRSLNIAGSTRYYQ